ncbi:hypothetical protein PG989_004540 [Apiospora arundinis]
MASNIEIRQPSNSGHAENKPLWEHIEDIGKAHPTNLLKDKPLPTLTPTIQISSDEESHDYEKPYSIFRRGMHASTANLRSQEWLTLAAENTHMLSPQTRRVIEKVTSLQKALSALSETAQRGRNHTSPGTSSPESSSSSSSSSSFLSAASAADQALQQAVEEHERSLHRLCAKLSRAVEEEMRQGMLHLAERQRQADGEQKRRELAKQQLKQREAEGIWATRAQLFERLGLSLENENEHDDDKGKGKKPEEEVAEAERSHTSMSAQEQREQTFERATALTKADWRKSW